MADKHYPLHRNLLPAGRRLKGYPVFCHLFEGPRQLILQVKTTTFRSDNLVGSPFIGLLTWTAGRKKTCPRLWVD
jgi:hypothetical protein